MFEMMKQQRRHRWTVGRRRRGRGQRTVLSGRSTGDVGVVHVLLGRWRSAAARCNRGSGTNDQEHQLRESKASGESLPPRRVVREAPNQRIASRWVVVQGVVHVVSTLWCGLRRLLQKTVYPTTTQKTGDDSRAEEADPHPRGGQVPPLMLFEEEPTECREIGEQFPELLRP